MNRNRTRLISFLYGFVGLVFPNPAPGLPFAHFANALQDAAPQAAMTRRIGAIKSINGSAITLTPDSGSDINVTVGASARVVRIAPGETNLKSAVPLQIQDLQVGDRILVGGKMSYDGKTLTASSVVVMKKSDVEAKQEKDRQDWQKRGLGGLVSVVDSPTGTVTISVASFGSSKTVAVHTSKATIIRRYSPDSVKFDDAKPSSLQEIKSGDQLRARGTRSADGSELAAEEIVSGSFRNVAGLVNSVDASTNILNVQDLLSKKPVQIKVSSDSQLHKLPPEMAQRIAMRLKGAALGGVPGAGAPGAGTAGGNAANGSAPAANNGAGGQPGSQSRPPGGGMGGGMGGMRAGGPPDFNQMLNRLPAVTLADLHKGDAVLVVATEGSANSASTAITLVSGVEAILQAAPSAAQAMMLAPWNLGGAPGGDSGSQ